MYMHQHGQIKLGSISTSQKEIHDLIKAWVALSLAFAILLGGSLFSPNFLVFFAISGLTVGVGFIFHELAHKVVAQKYGCFAEFRSFDSMLVFAILMSFFGFLFAAPGAVMIHGPVGVRRNGKIAVAGPLANLVIALGFVGLFFVPIVGLHGLARYGFMINTWLALFNMIPFGQFDGKKILAWNRVVYGFVVGVSILFLYGNIIIGEVL